MPWLAPRVYVPAYTKYSAPLAAPQQTSAAAATLDQETRIKAHYTTKVSENTRDSMLDINRRLQYINCILQLYRFVPTGDCRLVLLGVAESVTGFLVAAAAARHRRQDRRRYQLVLMAAYNLS